ncbi:AAA ATPase domain-containing protein [Geodermatophilus saharensis]|uniref:AAA ATPase domain-containing protein n=1 Tax=Geodermatophilus saharensis TaxID=1137994 RepID=A0A239HTN3_9ACTN|nr:BTAD domain-containing putative transcriptional regulator [Geodermatophilus saharensis]SNS84595.1 AAA ATPase domain-containing protein [Geodermatophilus saharensis]
MLGHLELRRDGVPVPIGARLQRAALTVLTVEAGRLVPVDRLADLLWNGAPPPKVAASVHTTIALLRRTLDPGRAPRSSGSVLLSAPPGYRLAREAVQIDADVFERLLVEAGSVAGRDDARAVALLDDALALWRGPALAEFADEPFARAAVDRWEGLRLGAVEQRAAALLGLGETGRAVADLQEHLTRSPLREQARATLARALYLAGRAADALAVLAEGRRLLRDELGLDPGPALREVEEQILRHDPGLRPAPAPTSPAASRPAPAPRPDRPPPSLRGREAECTLLADVLAGAAAGSGAVVLVTGDAGMGKSALLQWLTAAAVAAGGGAHTGTCRDGVAGPPYWPVLQALRAAVPVLDAAAREEVARALGPLRAVVPGLGDPPPGAGVDPAMVLVHLTDALGAVLGAAGRPAVLALDDLQAADPATLRLVAGLAADVAAAPAVLALALRSGEDGGPALVDALAALGRLPRLVRLDLEPLPADAVADLVRAAAPAGLGDDGVRETVTRAGGNPFFALELARAAPAPGGAAPTGRGRAVGGVPAAVHDVLRQRVLRLPPPGPELLTAAAVAGSPLPVEDLAAVAGVPVGTALDALEAAVAARLAVDGGEGTFAPGHALLGEVLRAQLSSARAARLHRAVGERLAARAGDDDEQASRVAAHLLAARVLDGGAAAVPWLERATDHAVRVSALDQLRELGGPLLAAAAALPAGPDRRRRELRALSRTAYADAWAAGYDSPTIREYGRLAAAWEVPDPPLPGDVELLWAATLFQCQVGRLDDADRTVARMAGLAGRLDDPTAGYLTEDITAVVRWMQARPAEALEHVDRAAAHVDGGRVDLSRSLAFSPPTRLAVVRALCLWLLGRRDDARAQADTALAVAQEAGLGAAGFARRWALVLGLVDGDPDRVRSLVALPLREPAWERYRYPSAVVAFAEGWLLAGRDPRAGLAAMRAAHAALAEQGLAAGRSVFLGLLAATALAAGDPAAAAATCEAGLAVAERGERYWVPELTRLLAAARAAGTGVSGHQDAAQSGPPPSAP